MNPLDLPLAAVLEEFEPRILYSADAAALLGAVGVGVAAAPWQQLQQSTATTAATGSRELVVLDLSLPDAHTLLAGLQAQREAGRPLDIVTLEAGADGVQAVTDALAGRRGLAAMHWLSHGADGQVVLGSTVVDARSLLARAGEFAGWGAAFDTGADLLIYGCEVGAGSAGLALLQGLSALVGVDVAASDDDTGATRLGGDWTLEQATGPVAAAAALPAQTQHDWLQLMTTGDSVVVVNTTDHKQQTTNSLARGNTRAVDHDAAGSYVVVWTSDGQDGSGRGIYARRFDVSGVPLTGEIAVNAETSGQQQYAQVVSDDAGNFVVVWTSASQDGDGDGVFLRRFRADGTALTGDIRVATTTSGDQTNAAIALNRTNGDFVVTWQGNGVGDGQGLFFRRFAADGTALDATERLVDPAHTGDVEANPTVAMDSAGRFVVAWEAANHVYFLRLGTDGTPQGSRVQIDTILSNSSGPALAMDAAGDFTAVYRESTTLTGVWGRGFHADGSARTTWFRVATGDATSPSVDAAGNGEFVVTWHGAGAGGKDVFARRYAADGTADGAAFTVNTSTAGEQRYASVAMPDANHWMVVFSGKTADDKDAVMARAYLPPPTAPVITSDGGGASATLTVDENTLAVTTVRATDGDLPAPTLSYSLSGTDAALFSIDGISGVLRFAMAPNAEAPRDRGQDNQYDIDVTVSDGSLTDTQHLVVQVNDLADGPRAVPDYASGSGGAITLHVLANDLAGADPSPWVLDGTQPAHGSVAIWPNGDADYAADALYTGTDVFRYLLTDDDQDLLHYWLLDGDGYDAISGVSDTVLPAGPAPTEIAGHLNRAIVFDRNNDGIRSRDIDYGSAGFSIGLWFQIDSTWPSGLRTLYGHGDASLADSVNIGIDGASRRLQVIVRDGNDSGALAPLSADVSALGVGTWHHVMVTVTPAGAAAPGTSVWLDNVLVASNGAGGDGVDPSGVLMLGTDHAETPGANFGGALDSVSVWGHPLTAAQRQAVYDGGQALGTANLTVTASAAAAPIAVADNFSLNEDGQLVANGPGGWYDAAWSWRQAITLDNTGGAAATDTVVLVPIDAGMVDYSRFRADGADLRIVDADGTLLPYEIETWNPSGNSRVWVRVPQIDGNSAADFLWLYGGNPAAADGQNRAALWSGAAAVVHLGNTLEDATGTANAVNGTSVPVVPGVAAMARMFDGTGSNVRVVAPTGSAQDDLFAGGGANPGGTVSAWFRADGWGEGGYGRIASKADSTFSDGSTAGNGWALQLDGANQTLIFEIGLDADTAQWRGTAGSVALGAWYHVAVVYDASLLAAPTVYLNGAPLAMTLLGTRAGTAGSDASTDIHIGNHAVTPDRTFLGAIDEFRAYTAARTAAQVQAEWRFGSGTRAQLNVTVQHPGVLGNDSDPGGLPLSAVLVSGPAHGALLTGLAPDGTFTYQPGANWTGTDSFQYLVTNGETASAVQTVALAVQAVPDAPVVTSQGGGATGAAAVDENLLLAATMAATDADTASSLLRWYIVGGADAARFSLDAVSGELRFVAAANHEQPADAGADNVYRVQVAVSDGSMMDSIDLSITVNDTLEPSEAVDDTASTTPDVAVTVSPLLNDVHDDAPTLRLLDARHGANGTIAFAGDQLVYQPGSGFTGSDSLAYRLTDGLDGLTHYWRLDGDAVDLLGGADGTLAGPAPGLTSGAWGDAVLLDGMTRYDLPDLAWAGSRTVSFWFQRFGNAGGLSRAVFEHADAGLQNGLAIGFLEDAAVLTPDPNPGHLRTALFDPGSGVDWSGLDVPVAGLADGNWHLYTLTMAPGVGSRVYIDGTLRASSSLSVAGLDPTATATLGGASGGILDGDYVGTLDSFAIHDRALAVDEVLALYQGGPSQAQIHISVAPVGALPPEISGGDAQSLTLPEGSTWAHRVVATDPNGPTPALSYTIVGGADQARFTIDGVTGDLAFVVPHDYEAPPADADPQAYHVVVQASDGTLFDTQTLTLTMTDLDEFDVSTPLDLDLGSDRVGEHAAVGSAVGLNFWAVDLDRTMQAVSWSLDDSAGGRFAIDPASGLVTLARPLSEEGIASHRLVVRATSADGSAATAAATVAVVFSNDGVPRIVSDGGAAVATLDRPEGQDAVTTVQAVDDDRPAETLTYRIAGGGDAALFVIDPTSGVLRFRVAPDAEVPGAADGTSQYRVTVEASDGLHAATQSLTIRVGDLDEYDVGTPADRDGAANPLAERAPVGTGVGLTVTAGDADISQNGVTWTLDDAADGRFAIDAATGVVTLARLLDEDGLSTFTITVRARSSDGSTSAATFDIGVLRSNDHAPRIVSDGGAADVARTVAENSRDVGSLQATDDDRPVETLRYRLAGGADAALFDIDAQSGQLVFRQAPDFESPQADADPQTYAVVVAVGDGLHETLQSWAVTVTDLDEYALGPVVDLDPAEDGLHEDAAPGTPVGVQAWAQDADGSAPAVRYRLLDDAGGRLRIDADTGVVTLARRIDDEGLPSHRLTVQAEAADGSVRQTDFELAVHVVNQAAPVPLTGAGTVGGAPLAVAENATAVLTVAASDSDVPRVALRYAIVGGADAARFEIDADTGAIRFRQAPDFEAPSDADGDNRYELVWAATDGARQTTQAITVTVTPVPEAPVLTSSLLSVTHGATQLALTAVDPDTPAEQLVYQVSGAVGGWFALRAAPQVHLASFTQAQVDAGLVVFRLDGSGREPVFALGLSDGQHTLPAASALVRVVGAIPLEGLPASTARTADAPAETAAPAATAAAVAEAVSRAEETLARAPTAAGPTVDALVAERRQQDAWPRPADTPAAVGSRAAVPVATASRLSSATGPDWGAGPVPDIRAVVGGRLEGVPAWRPVAAIDLSDSSRGRQLAEVLNRVRDEVRGEQAEAAVLIGSSALVSGGLSVGYVLWLLRGGVLVATVMSSVPAWAGIDPLPVLAQARRDDEDDADQDADPIERLFGRARRLMGRAAPAPAVVAPAAPAAVASPVAEGATSAARTAFTEVGT